MRKLLRFLLAGAVAIACSDTSAPPQPGTLTIALTTPRADDAAILFRVSGPTAVTGLSAASAAYTLYQRAVDDGVRVAIFGALRNGGLATFDVPDVARAAEYTVTVLEISDDTNALRAHTGGYQLTVRP